MKQLLIWIGALVVGVVLGLLELGWLNGIMNGVATVYTRLFQLLAVPTIVLAVTTTLATMGTNAQSSGTAVSGRGAAGRIFGRALTYTLLTTIVAAAVGLLLFIVISPGTLPADMVGKGSTPVQDVSYGDHLLSVVPNNIVRPFLEGNVLSLLILAAAVGLALSRMAESAQKKTVLNLLLGLQELLFTLIRGLVWTLPVGIVAFAAQLSAQLSAGVVADSLGKYVAVILGGNLLQFFVVLPLFLMLRGLNPLRTLAKMSPAVLMALFTKSSAATLPVTMETAEVRMGIRPQVARFVLPICTTINMNGCAAFILVTSLFVMQQGGVDLTWSTMITWLFIAVVSAVGNAGVPMGCYFLTFSLMSSINAPVALLGIILPIYTIIDMVETALNVWSDSCVATMVDHDLAEL